MHVWGGGGPPLSRRVYGISNHSDFSEINDFTEINDFISDFMISIVISRFQF